MEKLVSHMDQHGRLLIPASIRKMLHIHPGDKVNLEVFDHQVTIMSADKAIDEMHALFTKNKDHTKTSILQDFIDCKREEDALEDSRSLHYGE